MSDSKRLALAVLLLALPCVGQTPAEMLQRGIYAQETAGDPEVAMQIYRQITASAPAQSPVGAQAQFRIAEILLQKGDLSAASLEFNILATRYSENQTLIAKMATRLSDARANPANRLTTGTLKNGRYRNKKTGVEFAVPGTGQIVYDGDSSDGGEMVGFVDAEAQIAIGVWTKPETSTAAEIGEKLRRSPAAKVEMNAGTPGFKLHSETVQPRTVAGRQALTAQAEFEENGQKMAVIYTWVFTEKTHVVFIANAFPPSKMAAAEAAFDRFLSTAVVP